MNFFKGFLISIASLLIVACGGGGDGFNVNKSGVSYSGIKTPATITGDNAEEIATEAYQNGSAPQGAIGFGGSALALESQSVPLTHSRNLLLSETLVKIVSQIDFSSVSNDVAISAVQNENYSEVGSCGGDMSGSISSDDVTGTFSGSIMFNDYGCDRQSAPVTY